jgi:glycosyltransferase involved in cell wall biosynthesis
MNKPRILVFLPFLVNGALSLAVLREMRARGFEVTVVFCRDVSEIYAPDPMDDFRADGQLIDLSKVARHDYLQTINDEIVRRRTQLVLQIGATDLYHYLPYLKEQNESLRIVDTLYNEVGHNLSHFMYERCLDGVIVESRYMEGFVRSNSSKVDPQVFVVESGVDTNRYSPLINKSRDRGLVVGYVGRMSVEKNPLGFIEIAEHLYERLPAANFRMIGGGGQASEVERRLHHSRAGSQISYEGYAVDIAAALAGLDVLILPSLLDGRPNIVMEANACGVPVIGAPVGGVPEMIEDGRNGYLVAPDAFDRIGQILEDWSKDPASLAAIKQRSRDFAALKFDRCKMMDRYAEVFMTFCGETPIARRVL